MTGIQGIFGGRIGFTGVMGTGIEVAPNYRLDGYRY